MKNNQASIIEIFSSVQGEGLHIGQRQIFIRFHGCNLDCRFCDIDRDKPPRKLDKDAILKTIDSLNAEGIHNSICLTGGEPLLHHEFLKGLLPQIKERGFKVDLETNATLTKELGSIIEYVDTIAIDIKLPSVSQNKPCWDEHIKFFEAAFKREFFVKVVVSDAIKIEDFDKALEIMKDVSFDIPFVIQPETIGNSCELNIEGAMLLDLQKKALGSLNNVLVIPQAHKMLGVR